VQITVAAVLALSLAPAGAQAIGVADVSLTAKDTRAGAHSDVTLNVQFSNAKDDVKDVRVDLPPGLLGDPRAVPQCTEDQLQADVCPANTEVGTTTVTALASILPIPIPSTGTVYNVVPPSNRPARLGVVVRPLGGFLGKIKLIVDVDVRDDGDFGLINVINNIPDHLNPLIPVTVLKMSLTLDGTTPSGGKFMVNPTSCDPGQVKVTVDGYKDPKGGTGTSTFQATDCANEPYPQNMTMSFDNTRVDAPAAATIGLTMPKEVGDRVPSHTRKSIVRLPAGIGFNPAVAKNLAICTPDQFGPKGDVPQKCPANSHIGTVAFDNPLLGLVPGDVYFGRDKDHPYQIYIFAQKQGVTVKLIGNVYLNNDTGAITTSLDGIPPVPFTSFTLSFQGGPDSALVTAPACGTYTGSITSYPYSGGAPSSPTASATFSDDGQGNCHPTLDPTVAASVSTTAALKSPTLTLNIQRPDGSRPPSHMDTAMPPGLVGKIFDVPFCPRSQVGDCPASSRIGSVSGTIGSGPDTVTLNGQAFLTTGTSTSLARLVVELPTKVGPIDLGTFTLLAPLQLGTRDGRVHVIADLPTAFQGFPVRLRGLKLTINRKGFLLNPSGCDQHAFDVGMIAADGTMGAAQAPFQASACDKVPFRPKLDTQINDPSQRQPGNQPPITTDITKPPFDAAINDVRMLLAPGLIPNTDAMTRVCPKDLWARGACPASSRVGTAVAVSPLLRDRLTGPVYFAQTDAPPSQEPGLALPSLSVQLHAPGVNLLVDGRLRLSEYGNRLEAHFAGLPDVPLSEFRLTLDGGGHGHVGPVIAGFDLCSLEVGVSAVRMLDQSDRPKEMYPRVDAAACRKGALVQGYASGLAGQKPRMQITAMKHPSDRNLRRVSFRLPSGLRARSSKLGAGLTVAADGHRVSRSHWSVSRRGTVTVRVPGKKGAVRVTVVLARGALRSFGSLRQAAIRHLQGLNSPPPVELAVTVTTTDVTGRKAVTNQRFETTD
jgi:hypothetical protein